MQALFMATVPVFDPAMLLWLIPLMIWEAVWKGIALWKSGRNNQLAWFICVLVINTVGFLPIVYLVWFQKKNGVKSAPANAAKKKKKR